MTAGRLAVVDATFDHHLAVQLCDRGRRAVSAKQLGLDRELDDVLLPALTEKFAGTDWMLVTADDKMPATHKGLITALGDLTIATLDGRVPYGMDQEHYKFEVVHRWVHTMQAQEAHSIRRYRLRDHDVWTPIKGKPVAGR